MSFTVCLIGCGGIAISVYAESLHRYWKENPDTVYAACCDIDTAKAESFRQLVGFERAYTSYAEMLDKEKPDAVILSTPYVVTAAIASDVIRKGYPVLIEKPPGATAADCGVIAAAVKETGGFNQVAFNRRHMPLIRETKAELFDRGAKNPVQHIHLMLYRENRLGARFYGTAIHGIDAVSYLAQSPYRHIVFQYANLDRLEKDTINIFMQCEMASGATAQLAFVPASGIVMERLIVTADVQTYFIDLPVWSKDDNAGELVKYEENRPVYRKTGSEISDGIGMFSSNGFYAQAKHFLDHIREGKNPGHDIFSAIQAMEICDCIQAGKSEYWAG